MNPRTFSSRYEAALAAQRAVDIELATVLRGQGAEHARLEGAREVGERSQIRTEIDHWNGRAARLQVQRAEAARALESAETALRIAAPRLSELLRPSAITLDQLQGRPGPPILEDEALVLLAPGAMDMPAGQRRGFVFVITRERAAWAELTIDPDELGREIVALRADLDAYGGTRGFRPDAPPVAPTTPRFDRARSHRSLPFAALVSSVPLGGAAGDTDPMRLRQTAWLGLECTLSVLPSVSTLAMMRAQPSPSTTQARFAFSG